jgi:hypothetical protein
MMMVIEVILTLVVLVSCLLAYRVDLHLLNLVHIRTVLVEVTGAETRVGLRDRLFRV